MSANLDADEIERMNNYMFTNAVQPTGKDNIEKGDDAQNDQNLPVVNDIQIQNEEPINYNDNVNQFTQ